MDTQEPIQDQQPEHPITHEPRYWLITALAVVATALLVGGGMYWRTAGSITSPEKEMPSQDSESSQDVRDAFYSQSLLEMFRNHGGVSGGENSDDEKEFLIASLYGPDLENGGFSYEFRYNPPSGKLAATGMDISSSMATAEVAPTDVRDIVVVASNVGEYAIYQKKNYYINYTANELVTVENNNLFQGGRNMEIIIADTQGEEVTLKHSVAKSCDEAGEEAVINGLLLDELVIPFPEQSTYCSKDNYRGYTFLGIALTVTGISKDLDSVYFNSKGWHVTYPDPENQSILERNDAWSVNYVYDVEAKTVRPGEPDDMLTVFNKSYYNEH